MNLRISGKHMEIGDAFRSRIEGRIGEAVDKYFDGGFSGHVTVEKIRLALRGRLHDPSGHRHGAAGGRRGAGAADRLRRRCRRIEKRLRRYKRKLKAHPTGHRRSDPEEMPASEHGREEAADEPAAEDGPAIIAERHVELKRLVGCRRGDRTRRSKDPVLLFRNAGSGGLNIVYRRSDGNIGWIDPSSVPSN